MGHSLKISSESLEYVFLMFWPKPSGGSVTTLIDFWRIPNGKLSVGEVVSQSLKALSGFVIFSYITSSFFNQDTSKWQFYNITQWPLIAPPSTYCLAWSPIPYPKARNLNLFIPKPIASTSYWTSLKGSAPGLNINTIGVLFVDDW